MQELIGKSQPLPWFVPGEAPHCIGLLALDCMLRAYRPTPNPFLSSPANLVYQLVYGWLFIDEISMVCV